VRIGIRKTDPTGRLTYLDSVADLKSGRKALRFHANREHFDVNAKKEYYGKMTDEIPQWEEEIAQAGKTLGGVSRILLTSEHRRLVGSTWPTAGARTLMQMAVLFYEAEVTEDIYRYRQLFPQGGGAAALDLPDEWVRWLALSWGNYTIKMCGEINDENRLMHEVAYALYRKTSRSMTYQQALEAASDILTTGDIR
jgi:hypothetical protein